MRSAVYRCREVKCTVAAVAAAILLQPQQQLWSMAALVTSVRSADRFRAYGRRLAARLFATPFCQWHTSYISRDLYVIARALLLHTL